MEEKEKLNKEEEAQESVLVQKQAERMFSKGVGCGWPWQMAFTVPLAFGVMFILASVALIFIFHV